jgi:ABC-type sulfate/molybdate transport systems ATPase subunit
VDADFKHEEPLQIAPANTSPHLIKDPFRLADVDLQIPRGVCLPVSCANFEGSLVCVVGRVGTGKTALLDGMIGEIKRTRGQVIFGGSVAYGGSYLHLRMSTSPS